MKYLALVVMALMPTVVVAEEDCSEAQKSCSKECQRGDLTCRDECMTKGIACHKASYQLRKAEYQNGVYAARQAELSKFREKQQLDAGKPMSERSVNTTDKSFLELPPNERECLLTWQACLDRASDELGLEVCQSRKGVCVRAAKFQDEAWRRSKDAGMK